MRSLRSLLLSLIIISIISCKKEEIEIPPVPDFSSKDTVATYSVIFEGNWNLANQPTDYPKNAHFSKLVGMVHNNRTELIRLDRQASPGIKNMAETGGTSPLSIELQNIVSNGDASAVIIAEKGLATGVDSWSTQITVDINHFYISVVSMLAPSPDWFVGVSNLKLYDGEKFIEELNLDMPVYDAGTDSGVTYTSADSLSNPATNVYLKVDAPVGDGSSIKNPFARLVLKKIE